MPYSLREALAAFRRAPLLTGLSAAMIALSLFLVGLFGVVAHNVQRVLAAVEERVEIVAYLRGDLAPDSVRLVQRELAAYPEIDDVTYVSRSEAFTQAQRELPEFEPIFSDLDVNPLPASFEIRIQPGQRRPDVVRDVASRISAYPFIEDVRFGQEWLDKVFLLRRVAGVATFVLGGAFAVVAALIIGTAVRVAVFARRNEIRIMRLVGATDGFIRRPFLFEGLFTGVLGGMLALPATYGAYRLLSDRVFRVESEAVFQLAWMPDTWILGGLIAGAFIGLVSSGIAVRRHLKKV